jgi:oligopeptidase B
VPSDSAQHQSRPAAPAASPLAPRKPVRITLHGVTREDPYAWLRADNWREVMRDPAYLDSLQRRTVPYESEGSFRLLPATSPGQSI